MKPIQTGFALSITVAVFYSLCTVVEIAWPEQFMGFMKALFHGLDFRKLRGAEPFHWQSFLYALVVMTLWAFAIGTVFSWLQNKIEKLRYHGAIRHG